MLSTRRSEIAPARSKRSGPDAAETAGSTGAMVSAEMSGIELVMPRATRFYVARRRFVSEPSTSSSGQRFRACDHLEDLLRDLGLACAVHAQRERVDDLPRVLGRVAHGGH